MAIDEVEKRVTEWLRQRHPLSSPLSQALRECIAHRGSLAAELQKDIDEALAELERIQSGMP